MIDPDENQGTRNKPVFTRHLVFNQEAESGRLARMILGSTCRLQVVHGRVGIGKTRLIREHLLSRLSMASDREVYFSICQPDFPRIVRSQDAMELDTRKAMRRRAIVVIDAFDRFLLQVDVTYPDLAAERRMLYATTGTETTKLEAVISAPELMATQRLVRQIPVPDKVVEAILKLVRSARPGTGENSDTDRFVAWGPGPRASQAFMLAVRAKALIDGRLAPSVDDVIALAEPILKHRMALTFAARAEGQSLDAVISRLVAAVE